jgi:hypothetical protein
MTAQDWGRADADGTVYVRTADGERAVGQYPGVTAEDAVAYFVRKFEDLQAQVTLLEQRMKAGGVSPSDAAATLRRLGPAVQEANAVGDLDTLLARLTALGPVIEERRGQAQQARSQAREAAIAERNALVTEAEEIAGADPERISWKSAGDRLRVLFETWRRLQRDSRLDRSTEDELWRRFSHARTTFDRKRRQYFGNLDEQRAQARAVKEALVAEAETLAGSRDWAAGASAYRDLMARWKQAGRVARAEDDALWARFRAAQDSFFAARQAEHTEADAEQRGNLERRAALLAEAEALLPVTDPASARAALRDLQARWEAVGRTPRTEASRLEARLRKVEQAVRDADQARWRRRNPEARARAEDLVGRLESAIVGLESDLSQARAAADARAIDAAEQALNARREWLEQARRGLQEFTG